MSDDINRTSTPRCGVHFTAPITRDVAAVFDPNSSVVPVTGGRHVSDPRTDPGVRVRGARVGSSRPGCSPAPVDHAAKDAARSSTASDATAVRNVNVLQEKPSEVRHGDRRAQTLSVRRIGEHA